MSISIKPPQIFHLFQDIGPIKMNGKFSKFAGFRTFYTPTFYTNSSKHRRTKIHTFLSVTHSLYNFFWKLFYSNYLYLFYNYFCFFLLLNISSFSALFHNCLPWDSAFWHICCKEMHLYSCIIIFFCHFSHSCPLISFTYFIYLFIQPFNLSYSSIHSSYLFTVFHLWVL